MRTVFLSLRILQVFFSLIQLHVLVVSYASNGKKNFFFLITQYKLGTLGCTVNSGKQYTTSSYGTVTQITI